MNGRRKLWGVLLLATAGLGGGLSQHAQLRRLYTSTQHFIGYFRALENTDKPMGLWGRVTVSLVLTSTDAPGETRCP